MILPSDLQNALADVRAKVRFRYPWWLRPLLMRGVVGITIGRRIYLAASVTQQQVERFLNHELMHVRQINRVGLLRFYWRYLVEYVRNRRGGMNAAEAYRNISFEIEAVAAEERIIPGHNTMIEFSSLEPAQLERFLERQRAGLSLQSGVDLGLVLRQILERAFEFVPSESGSILLDDPFRKLPARGDNELVFVAAFGSASRELIGRRLSAVHGIVGQVYQFGTPHLSADVEDDAFFYREIDEQLGHKTHSIVAVPIYIGKHVCGVLELINRLEGKAFTSRDMNLLEIFAGYTSFMLQNALDARRAHELAKRDDLTGLYNDRWFNVRVTEALANARETGAQAVLIFLDLDHFKAINDSHGHLAGSQVLREVGFVLKRIIETSDATVARYGGDEFVMFLPHTSVEEGVAIGEEIRAAIETTTFLDREWGFNMPPLRLSGALSASIGVAQYLPDEAVSVEHEKNDLLRRADGAMYRAKSLGKNRIVVNGADERLQKAAGNRSTSSTRS